MVCLLRLNVYLGLPGRESGLMPGPLPLPPHLPSWLPMRLEPPGQEEEPVEHSRPWHPALVQINVQSTPSTKSAHCQKMKSTKMLCNKECVQKRACANGTNGYD